MKEHKKTIIATTIISLLPMLVGIILWSKLPDTMATHFGGDGNVNGWSDKSFVVFGLPIILGLLNLLTAAIVFNDPRKQNLSRTVVNIMLWIIPAASWICCGASYGYSLGFKFDVSMLGYIIMGIIFIVVGNYLPKCKQTYTVGIRTPWALNNTENWNKTHRMAGKLWVIAGIIILIDIIIKNNFIIGGSIAACVVIPYIYSFVLYKKEQ